MNDTKHETKQKASHTPRPWRGGRDLVMYGSSIVAQVYAGGDRVPGQTRKDTREANARLIAAPPGLPAAGEAVLANWERGALASAVRELADAIAEAKGLAA